MVSPLGKQTRGGVALQSESSEEAETDVVSQIDPEIIFRMIDGILPFEACLYHQILPLELKGSYLKLGMVNPDDNSALDYVRRILAYMNCSLSPQTISAEIHQTVLSAYLKRKQPNPSTNPSSDRDSSATPPQTQHKADGITNHGSSRPTLIVNSPEELEISDTNQIADTAHPSSKNKPVSIRPAERNTLILDADESASSALPNLETIQILAVEAHHLFDPIETLQVLPPKHLLHELLARVLVGGIGRLYLERQATQGRVLWSQNGVLQSVLQGLDVSVFQGLINELKRLAQLPLISCAQAKQVEFERLYKKERLLLRLRVMPGECGEEATLQVLRGAALKFHRQQQLSTLGRDALNIAQQLQRKLSEIRERTQLNAGLSSEQLEALTALDQLLKTVNQQLNSLKKLKNTS